jgi:hypothetical protein
MRGLGEMRSFSISSACWFCVVANANFTFTFGQTFAHLLCYIVHNLLTSPRTSLRFSGSFRLRLPTIATSDSREIHFQDADQLKFDSSLYRPTLRQRDAHPIQRSDEPAQARQSRLRHRTFTHYLPRHSRSRLLGMLRLRNIPLLR